MFVNGVAGLRRDLRRHGRQGGHCWRRLPVQAWFDSLADLVSFGVAPSILIFRLLPPRLWRPSGGGCGLLLRAVHRAEARAVQRGPTSWPLPGAPYRRGLVSSLRAGGRGPARGGDGGGPGADRLPHDLQHPYVNLKRLTKRSADGEVPRVLLAPGHSPSSFLRNAAPFFLFLAVHVPGRAPSSTGDAGCCT